jgi:hypothetical protein
MAEATMRVAKTAFVTLKGITLIKFVVSGIFVLLFSVSARCQLLLKKCSGGYIAVKSST